MVTLPLSAMFKEHPLDFAKCLLVVCFYFVLLTYNSYFYVLIKSAEHDSLPPLLPLYSAARLWNSRNRYVLHKICPYFLSGVVMVAVRQNR